MEEVFGVFGTMHFFSAGTFAKSFPGELVGDEVEGQRAFIGNAGEDDAHDIGDGEAHGLKNCGCLVFDLGLDSGSDYSVFGHADIVAQMGYTVVSCESRLVRGGGAGRGEWSR